VTRHVGPTVEFTDHVHNHVHFKDHVHTVQCNATGELQPEGSEPTRPSAHGVMDCAFKAWPVPRLHRITTTYRVSTCRHGL